MIAFAQVEDLERRWRALDNAERATAAALLEDASQLIRDEVADADSRPSATLRRIACAIVKRAMSGPGLPGVESTQQGAGPFQETIRFANPAGDLYLTGAEKRALGARKQRAFEIDPLAGSG